MNAALLLIVSLFAPIPDDTTPVARVGDQELERAVFEDWLFDRYAAEAMREFITMASVERGAREAGIVVTEDDVAARHAEQEAAKVERFFEGDMAAYEADLERLGYTPEAWRRFRLQQVRHELLLERLVLADRVVTDEQIEQRFDVIYGVEAERTEIELLFFSHRTGWDPQENPSRDQLVARSLARAEPVVERFRDGAPFEEVFAESDKLRNDFVVDGRVLRYRKNLLGPQVDHAVNMLDRPGEVSPIVTLFDGHVAVRLVRREAVTLEGVRDEIRDELMSAPPNSGEVMGVQSTLTARYAGESLLR